MIETDPQTKTDIREAVRLATSYAAELFRGENVKEFDKIPREQFVARCHEGFDLALRDFESGLRRKGDIVRPAARSLLTVGAVADADTHQCAVILNRIAPQAHPPVRSVMVTLIPVSQKSPLVLAARLNSAKDGS
jgi:hypothetical protein